MIFFNFFSIWVGAILSVVSVGMGVWERDPFLHVEGNVIFQLF